jgi:sulfatase modifying factor 1
MSDQRHDEPQLYAKSLDADVLAIGDLFGADRIVLRHSYNLLYGLYEVCDESSGMRKILLLLPRMVNTDPDFAARFNATCSLLRELQIPGLLKVEEFGCTDGRYYIKYEHFAGNCLLQWMEQKTELAGSVDGEQKGVSTPFTEDQVKSMLLTIGGALQQLHRHGIHHYNLTLNSILLEDEKMFRLWGAGIYEMIGKPLFERLASAGIPPIILKEKRRLLDPVAGMSPEMRAGNPPEPRADIHGLASISYEMLTHRLPATPLTPPTQIQAHIRPQWDVSLMKALARDPQQRQETISAFLRELDDKQTKPPSLWQKTINVWLVYVRLFLMRHALLSASLVMCIAAIAFFFHWMRTDESDLKIAPIKAVAPPTTTDSEPTPPSEAETPPAFAKLQITAQQDSQIFWRRSDSSPEEWQHLGAIDDSGTALFKSDLLVGSNDLAIRHPHYEAVELHAIDFPAETIINIELTQLPRPFGLQILSQTQGAKVFINGQAVGITPLEIAEMAFTGAVELRVELLNHHPYSTTIEPVPGSFLKMELPPLEVITRKLTVDLRASDSSRNLALDEMTVIRLNGAILTREIATESLELPLGDSTIEVSHPDYLTLQAKISLQATSPATWSQSLTARPARLHIATEPKGVKTVLSINGRPHPFATIIGLPAGQKHLLELTLEGYEVATATFQPKANAELHWRVAPDKLAALEIGSAWTFPYSEMRFVWIEGGVYALGSPRTERHRLPNENDGIGRQPEAVISNGFWIAEIPMTQAFYKMMSGENPSHYQNPNHPVENINWHTANQFAAQLTARETAAGRLPEGYVFRLPTQLEWELACRAGTKTPFSWGESATPEQGNFRGMYPRDPNRANEWQAFEHTTAVRSYPANAFGLFDMHGNVWEFTIDTYNDRYPNEARLIDWREERNNDAVVIRGGSWQEPAERARAASRERIGREQFNSQTGFRLVIGKPVLF